ncbi:MAG: UDP-N-acetylmuramoyl-L-alanine--D-glutamate ligase [Candidatus Pelagibacter sp.]
MQKETIFYKKNFLIYGFGKSGYASYQFLYKKNNCKIIDDNKKNIPLKYSHKTIDQKKLKNNNFDYIILSPGIDINKCKISKYLKKNSSKIVTELDIFYLRYPNIKKIAITGTNGKSTTSKLLYDVLKEHRKDVRLTGNIGSPTLLEKNIKNNTLFIIEVSSYQLEYSKFFKSEYSLILNLSPDHLERHGNFKKYVKAKFKLIQRQSKNNYAFIEKKNYLINNLILKSKINSKIYRVNYEKYKKYYKVITNDYFKNTSNFNNLSFIFAISKNFKISFKKIIKVVNKFKQLNFRQQIIYQSKKLIIINDSKSTSLSSTLPLLESFKNIYWILGGIAKKGDQLKLKKSHFTKIKAFIYGKDKLFFSKILSNKIKYKISRNLNQSLLQVFNDLKKKEEKKKILLFSPSAASFDQFKNFEDRGRYFNTIIKKYLKNKF